MNRHMIFAAGLAIAPVVLQAQTEPHVAFQYFVQGPAGAAGIRMIGMEGVGGQVVTGKPVSATEEHQTVQVLGDGTRIENKQTDQFYRDSEGRTRVEHPNGSVMIQDPVTGFVAEINTETKTVRRMTLKTAFRNGSPNATIMAIDAPPDAPRVKVRHILLKTDASNDAEVKAKAQAILQQIQSGADFAKLAKDSSQDPGSASQGGELGFIAKGQTVPEFEKAAFSLQPGQTSGVVKTVYGYDIIQVESGDSASDAKVSAEMAMSAGVRLASTGSAVNAFFIGSGDGKADPAANHESLGVQAVNGIMAQGSRSTMTIAIGKIGNDRPIQVVSEQWFSSDLQMLVKSTNSDPRFGETSYQLTNIVQAAPDPSLFQIPADYTPR